MNRTKDFKMEVMGVHNLFWESYARRDIDLRFSLCSEDVTFIGSGLHERALNKTEYKNINKEGVKQFPDPFQIEFLWTNITMLSENVACIESEVVWSQLINNEMTKELLRNTTLLKRENDKWLVTHVHGSVPDYRLKDGDYMSNEQTIIRNRELERQVFERTQDLNKTLEELEQKNRELEIETALEKVRSISMGMRKPDDMPEVCKTISLQLDSLGVKEIRNVQTAIFYEHRGTYMNYEYYAKHNKTIITEVIYTNHEMHKEFASKMLKGKGEFFKTHIIGKEVKDWIAYQKTTNVFIDKYLETASSVNYYWFSLGAVALGISTYYPLTDAEINLFQRFLKVFELAYQRYLDIEKAEAQAREAKIEAALEKVRAVAMSMNKPDDLLNICEVSFKEFKKLGFDDIRNALIHIQYDEQKYFMDYDFSDLTGGAITKIEYGSHPVVEDYLKQIRSAKDAFYQGVIKEDQLEEWKNFRKNSGQTDDPRLDNATALYYYFFSIGVGDIGISTLQPIDESQIKILKRFRNVFDLAYRRYNDIALAEEQAREAQIEAALERVRSRTMGMQKSEELKEVIRVVYEQFVNLKINVDHAGFVVDYKPKGDWHFWIADEQDIPSKITHPYFESVWANQFNEAKEKGADFFATNLKFEEKNKFYNELLSYVPGLPEASKDFYLSCPGLAGSTVLFDNVSLYIENFSGIPYTDDENSTLMRFGKVFQQTYTRFLDLQKVEAQSRESQIELALERVRARTMAMHKSEELLEVITVVSEQLKHLGFRFDHVSFAINNLMHDYRFWLSFADQPHPYSIFVPYLDNPIPEKVKQAQQKKLSFYADTIKPEDSKQWHKHVFENNNLDFVNEKLKQYIYKSGFARSIVLLPNIMLIVANYASKSYSEEENEVISRFANVFEQSYTRFLDLQKAEAQAREAQIQLALERVRARTMAMQRSVELAETVSILFKQLLDLGVQSSQLRTCGIVTFKENEPQGEIWITDITGEIIADSFIAPYDEAPAYKAIYSKWKNGEKFLEINLKGDDLLEHLKFVKNYSAVPNIDIDEIQKSISEIFFHVMFFSQGYLFIISYEPLSEFHEIFKRFGSVFQQAYTRFLDLQKAEAQAREARIEAALEKVRAVALSLKKSDEMLDIAQALYEQLLELGFTNIRNAIIDLHNDSNETFWDYDYSHNMGKTITLMTYHDDPIIEKQVRQIESSSDAFFELILEGQDLQDLIDMRLRNGENEDPRLRQIEQLTYNLYSFGNGAIGISNFGLLSDEQKIVLKRFRNVFAFAYKRYNDLFLAEAQAREAKIEASLERVRSKAMAMHSPNDLSETINVFFKELKTLGIIPIRCGVGRIDGATRTTSLTTTTSSQQGDSFQVIGKVKQTGHPVLDGIFDHWKLQKEYHPVLEGEDIKAYYDVMNAQIGYPEYPEEVTQYGNCFFFKEGFVFAWTESKLSEEELQIFRRFTSVLSLTYRRFLDLTEAEEKNKIIQADNDRKTKELEEARELQISLLPTELPKLPEMEIAAYMRTATEVGGDYYDFIVQKNGVLNVALGDATGHGLQAGTMVTLMKGLFTSQSSQLGPKEFMSHCAQVIKDIKLGRILMSFSYLRFENNQLLASSAGMPPIYYHHKKNNRTEEIIIQGMPLGAMRNVSYNLVEKQLCSGDTILLLTDGLPEQMNRNKVPFDYSRVQKYFSEIAENTPDDIIKRLVKKADEWMDGIAQADDITFVIIRVK